SERKTIQRAGCTLARGAYLFSYYVASSMLVRHKKDKSTTSRPFNGLFVLALLCACSGTETEASDSSATTNPSVTTGLGSTDASTNTATTGAQGNTGTTATQAGPVTTGTPTGTGGPGTTGAGTSTGAG